MTRQWLNRAAALLLAAGGLSAAPAHAEWLEASTSHFVIYGDVSQTRMADFAEKLERFDSALRFVLKTPPPEPGVLNRVTIFMVHDEAAVQRRASLSNVAGFYRATADGAIAVTPERTTEDRFTQQVLFHEYVHHLTLGTSSIYYPGWASEGLAEFFGTAAIDRDGTVRLGVPNNARAYSILDARQMAVERLLSDSLLVDDDDVVQKYARGWLLTHYLMLSDKRPGQFDAYINLINHGTKPADAGQKIFGDPVALDRELNDYRRHPLRIVLLQPEKLHPEPIAIRTLGAAEAAIMPYRSRSATGVNAQQAAALVGPARRVAQNYPADAFVQRALAEIEFDAGNLTEADAACDRALAIDPGNFGALMYKGRVQLSRAAAAKPAVADQWLAARAWFLKANKADGAAASPFVLYYDSFLAAGETPSKNAVDGLMRAAYLVPQDNGLRWRVVVAMINAGNLPLARYALRPLAFNPHNQGTNPAQQLLTALESTEDPAVARAAIAKLGTAPAAE